MNSEDQDIYELFSQAVDLEGEELSAFLTKVERENSTVFQRLLSLLNASKHDVFENIKKTSLRIKLDGHHPFDHLYEKLVIDQLVLKQQLSKSKAAAVYLGFDLSLARNILLKFHLSESKEPLLVARINHDHIVKIYFSKHFPELNLHATAFEWIDGLNLSDWFDQELPKVTSAIIREELALRWSKQFFLALKEIHKNGILHLDIKPQNILVDRGLNCKITDFNVSSDTTEGLVIGGSRDYMAPEQTLAIGTQELHRMTEAADVFAVGKVIQELILKSKIENGPLTALSRDCQALSPESRPTVNEALRRIEICADQFAIRRNIEATQSSFLFYKASAKYPILSIVLSILMPNVFASVLQILYNKTFIIDNLSNEQIVTFQSLLLPWNLIVYTVGTTILTMYFLPIFKFRHDIETTWHRIKCAHLFSSLITFLLWIVSCAGFVAAFATMGFSLPFEVLGHFILSFLMAAIMQGMFVSVSIAYLTYVLFAPKILSKSQIAVSQEDLGVKSAITFFKFARFGVGTTSLVIVIVLTILSRDTKFLDHRISYETLVAGFCFASMIGYLFGVSLSDRFSQSYHL